MEFMHVLKNAQSGEVVEIKFSEKELINLEALKIEEEKAAALAELATIDASSVRALREYIVSQADAPAYIKAKEAAAVLARGKLK